MPRSWHAPAPIRSWLDLQSTPQALQRCFERPSISTEELLDGESAVHARCAVPRRLAEERVRAWLEADADFGCALRREFAGADLRALGARAAFARFDRDVVRDARHVGHFDRDLPSLRCGLVRFVGELTLRIGGDRQLAALLFRRLA